MYMKDIICDRCGQPARFDVQGGNCENCGDDLCADCAKWESNVVGTWCEKCRNECIEEYDLQAVSLNREEKGGGMTEKKGKCTTFVVEAPPPNLHWFHRWNPLALRSHIRYLEAKIAEQTEKISYLWRDKDDYIKRIESLESELRLKERQCELSDECAKHNLKEKEKELGLMRSEIYAAIGLLQGVAEERTGTNNCPEGKGTRTMNIQEIILEKIDATGADGLYNYKKCCWCYTTTFVESGRFCGNYTCTLAKKVTLKQYCEFHGFSCEKCKKKYCRDNDQGCIPFETEEET